MAGKSKRNNEDNIPEGLDDLLNELTGNKNDNEDNIPEGLDDLLNELTGNKNNREDSIPEGLDDLLNEIKGKKRTATKPKRKKGIPRKKKTSPPGALTKYSKTEDIDSRILELLGLEYTFDLDYDDYANLLKEKLIEVSKGTDDSSTEDAMLLREELKKVRKNKEKGTFKVKKKISKDKFTNFNVGKPKKDTAQTRKPSYGLLQGKEIAEKSQRASDLKEEQGEEQKEKKKRKQSDNQILKSISKSLDRIIGILNKQNEFEEKQAEKQRKLEETGKRKDKENEMESGFSKGIKALASVASKVFSPLQNFFDKIINFFTIVFFGKVVKKFLEWFTDPKNQSKVETLGRLLKTFWPAILAGLVFLNPLGRLITKAVFVIGKGVARLLKVAIPSLIKFARRNPRTAAAVGLFTAGATIPMMFPGTVDEQERKTEKNVKERGEDNTRKELERKANEPNFFERLTGQDSEAKEQLYKLDTGETKSYKSGGKVTTESGKDIRGAGVDTQLIAARPGEVVINKETVNAVGADYFLGLNKQYGGANANKPKTVSGVQTASGGGLVVSAFAGGGMVGGYESEESKLQKPRKPSKMENDLNELRQMRVRSLERQGRSPEASTLQAFGTDMPNLLGNKRDYFSEIRNSIFGLDYTKSEGKKTTQSLFSQPRFSVIDYIVDLCTNRVLSILDKRKVGTTESSGGASDGTSTPSGGASDGTSTPSGGASDGTSTPSGGVSDGDHDTFAKEMIKVHEGLRLDKYSDSRGFPTIGYGHLIEPGETMPNRITKEKADELFDKDYEEHKRAAEKIPGFAKANAQQKAAVVDLTFNMGPAWADGFPSFRKAFAAGDYEAAGNHLVNSAWYKQVGRRSSTIVSLIKGKGTGGASYLGNLTPPSGGGGTSTPSGGASGGTSTPSGGATPVGETPGSEGTGPKVKGKDDSGNQTGGQNNGKVIEYITGDRSSKNYRSDHGGANYHDHIAFDSKKTRDAAISWLSGKGWTIGSKNDGKHASGSYHYTDQAFDLPFYPNQSKKGFTDDAAGETKLSSLFRSDLASGGFTGSGVSGGSGGSGAPKSQQQGEAPGSEGTGPKVKGQEKSGGAISQYMDSSGIIRYDKSGEMVKVKPSTESMASLGSNFGSIASMGFNLKESLIGSDKPKKQSITNTIDELRQMRVGSLERQGKSSEASILQAFGTKMPSLVGTSGLVKENSGKNIFGKGSDRQQIWAQPGEYILPVDFVNKIGVNKLDNLVANFDSNSNPAKMGLRNQNISQGIQPYSSGETNVETLPLSGTGGGMGGVNSPNGSSDQFFSPISPAGEATRKSYLDIMGISAFT